MKNKNNHFSNKVFKDKLRFSKRDFSFFRKEDSSFFQIESRRFFLNKSVFEVHRKNLCLKADAIKDLVENLRKVILSLISNGFEFSFEENYKNDAESQIAKERTVIDVLKNIKLKKGESFISKDEFLHIFKIISDENNLLLEEMPRALGEYFKLKEQNQKQKEKLERVLKIEEKTGKGF